MTDLPTPAQLERVPLFPLPNVVLLPHAVLPLHIFEERYKTMTEDALAGDRLIAMALLRPGWEKDYYSRPAIEPVACVGRILSHERLPGRQFNFLLQGVCRTRIVHEKQVRPYRQATLELIHDDSPLSSEEQATIRQAMVHLFSQPPFSQTNVGRQFQRLCERAVAASQLIDLTAFTFIEDLGLRQSLLADASPLSRARRVLTALDDQRKNHPPTVPIGADPSLN